jgi:hypothetical protein
MILPLKERETVSRVFKEDLQKSWKSTPLKKEKNKLLMLQVSKSPQENYKKEINSTFLEVESLFQKHFMLILSKSLKNNNNK